MQANAIHLAPIAIWTDVGLVGENIAKQVRGVVGARPTLAMVGDIKLVMLALNVCGLDAAAHFEGYRVYTTDEYYELDIEYDSEI